MNESAGAGLAHVVFFTLKDNSEKARNDLAAACQEYLTDHPGTVHFSVGLRGERYNREVNDDQFDVALIVVFTTEADHDRYQTADRHQTFIEQQSHNWRQVRVFDSLV